MLRTVVVYDHYFAGCFLADSAYGRDEPFGSPGIGPFRGHGAEPGRDTWADQNSVCDVSRFHVTMHKMSALGLSRH